MELDGLQAFRIWWVDVQTHTARICFRTLAEFTAIFFT